MACPLRVEVLIRAHDITPPVGHQGAAAGEQGSHSATRKGKGRAARALRLAAWSLLRSKSYLGAYLRRQRSRLGSPKAITAAAYKLARIVYGMMRYGAEYVKETESAYAEEVRERLEVQLRRRAAELGFDVTKREEEKPE